MDILKITEYIFIEPKLEKADLVFVFGTRYIGAANKAYELYKNKQAQKILITGGENHITGEGEALKLSQELMGLGAKKEDIILEEKSTNTLENVLFSRKIIEEKIGFDNIKKIMVVTKNYHVRRAIMTLKKHFLKSIKLFSVPYEVNGWNKNNWHKAEESKKKIIGEFEKIQKYLKKGDIEEL